jgi:octaprenyl-diphosphate synthase
LLATKNQEMIDTFTTFGYNLGMAAQITNDIQGIMCGSDITKHRITLPVIFALSQTDSEVCKQLETVFGSQSKSVTEISQIRDLLFRSGAIHYATIRMELFKQKALDVLSVAKKLGASVERLKLFIE